MAKCFICFTIDTDPDGVTGRLINRSNLRWQGLEGIGRLMDQMAPAAPGRSRIPITWFVRADGQLRTAYGTDQYLLERFAPLWSEAAGAGDEIGWHPHLYRHSGKEMEVELITDSSEAVDELERICRELRASGFQAVAFRNGEGWHTPATYAKVEDLGFLWDCTAIPGRKGPDGHPLDWLNSPNQPYFPGRDLRSPGAPRRLLEIPINTWFVQASYDQRARLRYINPAIHEPLFLRALEGLELDSIVTTQVWTMVVHPDECLEGAPSDELYSRSPQIVCRNLQAFACALQARDHDVQFATMSQAGREWLGGTGSS